MNIPGHRVKNALLFLVLICHVLLFAQYAEAKKTIGVIMTGDTAYYREIHDTFTAALTAEGIGKGDVDIILQVPFPEPTAWKNSIRKFVAYDVDLIVSYGTPATMEVLNEAPDIPLVFAGSYDPQAFNLSGRNSTGVSSNVPLISLLKYFKGISDFLTLGIAFSDVEKDTVYQAEEVKKLEGKLGFRSSKLNIKTAGDIAQIRDIQALLLTTTSVAMQSIDSIVSTLRRDKIPVASIMGGGERSGIVLTISANPQEQGREAAKLAAEIMRGAKPSGLPVKQPKKVDIVINLQEAKNMGLTIPFSLLTSATEVIK